MLINIDNRSFQLDNRTLTADGIAIFTFNTRNLALDAFSELLRVRRRGGGFLHVQAE